MTKVATCICGRVCEKNSTQPLPRKRTYFLGGPYFKKKHIESLRILVFCSILYHFLFPCKSKQESPIGGLSVRKYRPFNVMSCTMSFIEDGPTLTVSL